MREELKYCPKVVLFTTMNRMCMWVTISSAGGVLVTAAARTSAIRIEKAQYADQRKPGECTNARC
jgi:hypothetical protein